MTVTIFLLLIFANYASGTWHCGPPVNCGWNQSAESPLVYPKDGGTYNNDANCRWIITAPSGYRIKTDNTIFLLQDYIYGDYRCRDFIWFEVPGWRSENMCRRDGQETFQMNEIETPGEVLTIGFRSDNDAGGKGFAYEFELIQRPIEWHRCSGDVQLQPGDRVKLIHQYGNKKGLHCSWSVNAIAGKLIEIKVKKLKIWWNQMAINPCTGDTFEVSPIGGASAVYCGVYVKGKPDGALLERLVSSDHTMKVKLNTIKKDGAFGGIEFEFGVVDAGSVVVQQILNLYNNFLNGGHRDTGDGTATRDAQISVESGSKIIYFHTGMVAQLVHETHDNVTIIIRTYKGDKTVTFDSKPNQSWVVMQDGIYKQDGSSDVSATASSSPDFKWTG